MTQPEQETSTPAPIKRARKTAADKAQAALDVANHKLASIDQRIVKARAEVAILLTAREKLDSERAYLARNPALVQLTPATTPIPEEPLDEQDEQLSEEQLARLAEIDAAAVGAR